MVEDGLDILYEGLPIPGGNGHRRMPPCHVSWQNESHLRFALKGIAPEEIERMCAAIGLTVEIDEGLRAIIPQSEEKKPTVDLKKIPKDEYGTLIRELTGQMELASANLEFEKAAELRDLITEIREKL